TTGGFYNFSNIRYAAPPVGNLRFQPPSEPETNRTSIDQGTVGRMCPQSTGLWVLEALEFVANYTQRLPFDPSLYTAPTKLPMDPRETEDCLFLDVVVSQKAFEGANDGSGAPVMLWIHGGGYTSGSKDFYGIPAGILARSEQFDSRGVVFVAINYRLGAFGFSAGSTIQSDGVSNAGLLDQRFALDWVQKHISKFGGDPQRVTVIGESAGGGSIMHQITAYGGKEVLKFNKAIAQSPGYVPYTSPDQQEANLQEFLSLLNVSTLAEARALPSSNLIQANIKQVAAAPYSSFIYGPVVDGSFVPEIPPLLLLHGQFDHNVEIMVGHNADEGLLFTDPTITTDDAFNSLVSNFVSESSVVSYIENTLYPPIFNGSMPYTDDLGRASVLTGEFVLACNTFYLDTAFLNETYAYIFSVPPALHGNDLPYTFYAGPYGSQYDSVLFNTTVAAVLQDYITSFAVNGRPSTAVQDVPSFGKYGPNAVVSNLGSTGITRITDNVANSRCKWWQLGLYT
ncbi:hypothetical protein Egran_02614, partial [Elaphomyces granulatus]